MTVVEQVLAPVVTERERRARVLEAAALEIEVRGWCRVDEQNDAGNVCLVGAVACAMGISPRTAPYTQAAHEWYGHHGDDQERRMLWHFNDGRALAADEVTFALRWRAEEIRDGR